MKINNLCVFAGSHLGNDDRYRQIAVETGELFASQGWNLVYGGGNRGLMGELARAMRNGGSYITGITAKRFHLTSDVSEWPAHSFELCDNLSERKNKMFFMSDAFLVVAGGMGTFDEFSDVATLAHIGCTNKPIAILDIDGFWDGIFIQMEKMKQCGFLSSDQINMTPRFNSPLAVVDFFNSYDFHEAPYELKGKL